MDRRADRRRAWQSVLLVGLLATALTGCTPSLPGPAGPAAGGQGRPAAARPGPPEYHALWVDAFHPGLHSRREIDRLVETAQRANVNSLIVQVRKSGDAYYLQSLEPQPWDIFAPPSFDPLAYLVRRAHAAGPRIEVHAWVNTFFVGRRSRVYWEHGAEWGDRTHDGRSGGYLDPGHPAVREYTRQVFVHLAQRYDVDGLHLDFVRYPEGGDWGYSRAAVQAFNASTARSGEPEPSDPAWKQWRREQVTAFVRDLAGELAAKRPRIKLSAALVAWGPGPASEADWQSSRAYDEVYQDWHGWLREGILDLGVVMNYDSAWSPRTARWFEQWIEWEKDNQHQRRIVIGVGAYLNYPEDTLFQLRRALAPSALGNRAAGAAVYSYASTSPYGTDDYYGNSRAAAALPRQPYGAGLDGTGLQRRAERFNEDFWTLLVRPGSYADPVVGRVTTEPAFSRPAAIPELPWKQR